MLGELDADQIECVLSDNVIGRIGCYAEGRVYVVPVTYAYDGSSIFGHTTEGLKIRMLRHNPECCFEVDQSENMAHWQSVITWGTFEELKGKAAEDGIKLLIDRLMPVMSSQTSLPEHAHIRQHNQDAHGVEMVVYRIRLKQKTGRFEKRD